MIRGSPSTRCVSFANALRLSFVRVLCEELVDLLPLLLARLRRERSGDVVDVDPRVPLGEDVHLREALHRRAVGAGHGEVDRLSLLGLEATIATGDGEARDEPLQVPLERARQRLVEVVDAEDETSVGRSEHTEVGEMRIAAELDFQPRPGVAREIGRHQVSGAAEERERRDEHAPVANRHQLLHARGRLLLEQLDRITPARRRHPLAEDRPPDLGPRGPPLGHPLARREVRHDLRPRRPSAALRRGRSRAARPDVGLGRGHERSPVGHPKEDLRADPGPAPSDRRAGRTIPAYSDRPAWSGQRSALLKTGWEQHTGAALADPRSRHRRRRRSDDSC